MTLLIVVAIRHEGELAVDLEAKGLGSSDASRATLELLSWSLYSQNRGCVV
jgi:hypothetical protein